MTADLSILSLITNASVLVQLVMLLLLVVSLMSWNIIFQKRKMLAKARERADEFEERFWSGGDLSSLYSQVTSGRHGNSGLSVIFEAGFKEFGMELLTPAEFLDTDEKREFFEGFNQESGKKEKTKCVCSYFQNV